VQINETAQRIYITSAFSRIWSKQLAYDLLIVHDQSNVEFWIHAITDLRFKLRVEVGDFEIQTCAYTRLYIINRK